MTGPTAVPPIPDLLAIARKLDRDAMLTAAEREAASDVLHAVASARATAVRVRPDDYPMLVGVLSVVLDHTPVQRWELPSVAVADEHADEVRWAEPRDADGFIDDGPRD